MQALILAGGEGTRLRPLTYTVPKPVLPLAGRPHLAYVIDWLRRHGVDDVVVSCGHLAEGMREAVAELGHEVRITFAEEPDARGTAGAIRFAEDLLGDRFLVLNGDVLCDLDLTELIAHHRERRARATLALYPVENPIGYGLVRRQEDGEITEFLEKPEPEEIDTDEISAGAYLLERSVLDLIPPGGEVSIEREVFPELVGNGLFGVRLEGYWIDIGTPDRFLQATWDILEGRVKTATTERVGPDGLLIDDGADVGDGSRIEAPALVADGVRIAPGTAVGPRAVIGPGSELDQKAAVRESVLLDGCRVGAGAQVTGAILSARVEISPGAEVRPGAVVGEGETVGAAA
jgi:mannose-1-phosphate guanylyltransferase